RPRVGSGDEARGTPDARRLDGGLGRGPDAGGVLRARTEPGAGRAGGVPDRSRRHGEAGDGGSQQLSSQLQAPPRGQGHAPRHRGVPGSGTRPVGGIRRAGLAGGGRRAGGGRSRLRSGRGDDPRRATDETGGATDMILALVADRTAPAELRARLAYDEASQRALLDADRPGVGELAVLCTCHRTEAYFTSLRTTSEAVHGVAGVLPGLLPTDVADLRVMEGLEAVEHLFRVTCGLDSRVVGGP